MRSLKASLPSDPLNEVEINGSYVMYNDSFMVYMWSTFLWKRSFVIYDLFFHSQFQHQTHLCWPPLIHLKGLLFFLSIPCPLVAASPWPNHMTYNCCKTFIVRFTLGSLENIYSFLITCHITQVRVSIILHSAGYIQSS